MKILFSVNKEDYETGSVEHIESVLIQTNWSLLQIDAHLNLHDGFRSEIVIGENLSVFDYYCYFEFCGELIAKIKSIPSNEAEEECSWAPTLFRVKNFNPGNADSPEYPEDNRRYLFELSRYELGVSSYEAIVLCAASHPLEMMFIGGALYDAFKWLIGKLLVCFGVKCLNTPRCPVVLNTKKLYRNFARLMQCNERDCQIIKFNRLKVGTFHVKMCTTDGKRFKLKCYVNGKIESLEEIRVTKN